MAVLDVRIYPDPVLRSICATVTEFDNRLRTFAQNLEETMYSFPGCVGIAAPQTGELIRLFLVDVSRRKKAKFNHGLMALVNPVILEKEGESVSREGCLSVPEFTGNVSRATRIFIEGQDLNGEPIAVQTEGFEAVAFQHEMDHLDGIIFLDRVRSSGTDIFRR
ncbi:MAG: peptide deformylase [Candidatus Theseobacter exili]|nr:peptide deformylase [Candidatus Theseobacter exili]